MLQKCNCIFVLQKYNFFTEDDDVDYNHIDYVISKLDEDIFSDDDIQRLVSIKSILS